MGWIADSTGYCYFSEVPYQPDGSMLDAVTGMNGPTYGMSALCVVKKPAWPIPSNPPILGGPTAMDKAVTSMMNEVRSLIIGNPNAKPKPRKGSAERYYDAATGACRCLPSKYVAPTKAESIKRIQQDLFWSDAKSRKVWEEAKRQSALTGVTIDPRLLLAVIRAEGTGSFNTNFRPKATDGGGYIQPDFDADLREAFNGHAMGKIRAYSHYAAAYQRAASAAANSGRTFLVYYWLDPDEGVCKAKGYKTISYSGKGGHV
jgi:hypothetical protein